MGVSQQFIRIGLQRKLLPIGTAVQNSSIWTYHISPKLFYDYIGQPSEWEKCVNCKYKRKGDIENG